MFKKALLTLSLMAMVGMITAQSLQFEHEGTVYQDGETIVCQLQDFEYVQELQIRNLTDNQLDVIVEKEIIDDLEGVMNYFCWGLCYDPNQLVSDPWPIAAQSLSEGIFSFHFIFDEGVIGTPRVRVYAYARSNPDERISLIFEAANTTNVAENTLSLGKPYPNPASSQVSFDFKAANSSNINVVVYNLLGQEVKSQLANGMQGRINIAVDDLQPGIYFCSFQVNNEVVKTEKFIVKR
jgi:hypothetical protein